MFQCQFCSRRAEVLVHPCDCNLQFHVLCFKWHLFLSRASRSSCPVCESRYQYTESIECFVIPFIVSMMFTKLLEYVANPLLMLCLNVLIVSPLPLKWSVGVWTIFLLLTPWISFESTSVFSKFLLFHLIHHHLAYLPFFQPDIQ